ncbi:carboxypeptidase-like regulatory domain-containing protein [Bremerella sp. JC770]|uniref:carboxypeptidase-like regulatory domain-containing protein n=1 Tax=Bremerella sp. JC770 TaxID=3232137 RepID=UPI003458F5F7
MTFKLAVLLAAITLTGTGCYNDSLKTAPIEGTITWNGEPVEGAEVMFVPVDGKTRAAAANSDANGKYQLFFSTTRVGAPLGTHRVQITYDPYDNLEDDKREVPYAEAIKMVDQRFRDGSVEVVVENKTNVFDFEIAAEAKK